MLEEYPTDQLADPFADVGDKVAANITDAVGIAKENVLVNRLKNVNRSIHDCKAEMLRVIDELWTNVVPGAKAVRFMAVLAVLRDSIKHVDGLIGSEIDSASSTRQAGRLHELVANYFEETGRQSEHIEGRTVYLKHDIWASAVDIQAIKAYEPLTKLVQEKVNGQTLSAQVREYVQNAKDDGKEYGDIHEVLPAEMRNAVRITELVSVRTRKS